EVGHKAPWFLPDGRRLLFLALASGQMRGVIWATTIDNPARIRIVESSGGAAYSAGWLLSTTDQRALPAQPFDPDRLTLPADAQPVSDRVAPMNTNGARGFTVSAGSVLAVERPSPLVSRLVWMDRTGRTISTVSRPATITGYALAPDEHRVVAEVRNNDAAR